MIDPNWYKLHFVPNEQGLGFSTYSRSTILAALLLLINNDAGQVLAVSWEEEGILVVCSYCQPLRPEVPLHLDNNYTGRMFLLGGR